MKAFWESIKPYILFILAPFGILLAVIYYLMGKNRTTESQLNQIKSEEVIKETLHAKEIAKTIADNKEAEYERLRDAYVAERDRKGGVPGDSDEM